MNEDAILIDNKFYNPDDLPLVYSSGSYPSGDGDGYLGHRSFKIWKIPQGFFMRHYDEGERRYGFLKLRIEGSLPPEYPNGKYGMIINLERAFYEISSKSNSNCAQKILEKFSDNYPSRDRATDE